MGGSRIMTMVASLASLLLMGHLAAAAPSASCNTWPSAGYLTLFAPAEKPSMLDLTDGQPLVLGHTITSSVAGDVYAARYYKAISEKAAIHQVMIYSWPDGKQVATSDAVSDASCSGGKWVSIPLTTPYRLSAGAKYVVAIDNVLYYTKTDYGLPAPKVNGPLSTVSGGSYYSFTTGAMPSKASDGSSNYWIDVEFYPAAPPSKAPTTPPTAAPTLPPPTYAPTKPPTPQGPACGAWPASGYLTLFAPEDKPSNFDLTDYKPLVLGHTITTSVAGDIVAIRYYKAISEKAAFHEAKIYTWPEGKQVATTGSFSDTSCAGPKWVSAPLTAPYRMIPGARYVVAVESLVYYSKTDGGLQTPKVKGPLSTVAGGSYYGFTAGAVPKEISDQSGLSNYWIDVEFYPGGLATPPPTPAATPPPTPATTVPPTPAGTPAATKPPAPVPAPATTTHVICSGFPPTGYQTYFLPGEAPTSTVTSTTPLVIGVRFSTVLASDISALRYFKVAGDTVAGKVMRIFKWPEGGAAVATTGPIQDSFCAGPLWVSAPLVTAFRTTPGKQYVVTLEGVRVYASTPAFFTTPKSRGSIMLMSSVTGTTPNAMPTDTATQTTNPFLDVTLLPAATTCDELNAFSPNLQPLDALNAFGAQFRRYPTRTVLGTCGPIGGFPASPSRPSLFGTPMFVTQDGREAFNNFDMLLPIVKTYTHLGRNVDVFEEISVEQAIGDFFPGERLSPASAAPPDACTPPGYTGTHALHYASASTGSRYPSGEILTCTGRQAIVRFCNNANQAQDRTFSVHLHGSGSTAIYDGWAEDIVNNGLCKEYLYPGNRAAPLWYHDHTLDWTADNTYAGLAGTFLVRDCESDLELNFLPKTAYIIPYVIKDFVLQPVQNPDGTIDLEYQAGFLPNPRGNAHIKYLWADINTINGRPWPYLKVEPRTYRLTVLNAGNSRDFSIKMLAETADGLTQAWVDFYLIATDGGFIQVARKLNHLFISPAERYEVLVNFNPAFLPSVPAGGNGPWAFVYVVNDFGNKPDSDAPVLFCKSHMLSRFDLGIRALNPDPALTALVDTQWPPTGRFLVPRRGLHSIVSNTEYEFYKNQAWAQNSDREMKFGRGRRNLMERTTGPKETNKPGRKNAVKQHIAESAAHQERIRASEASNIANRNLQVIPPLPVPEAGFPWVINGQAWKPSPFRANPARDSLELWEIGGAGGWHHPIHIHLVDYIMMFATGRAADSWVDWDILTQSVGPFRSLEPLKCFVNADCPAVSACVANVCTLGRACVDDSECPFGTHCRPSGQCEANGLRIWEQDAPKDVGWLGNGNNFWMFTRFGPFEADYMFHCHNTVHEDNAMMGAFGVSRPVITAATRAGDGIYGTPIGAVNVPPATWVAEPYRSQLALTAQQPVAVQFDGLSPQASTFPNGIMNEDMRDPETILFFQAALRQNFAVDLPGYFCRFLWNGIYDAFYPPVDNATLFANHLALRGVAELLNQNFPGSTIPGNFFYNPIQQNIWAVNFLNPLTQNPPPGSQRRAPTWSQVICADVPPAGVAPAFATPVPPV